MIKSILAITFVALSFAVYSQAWFQRADLGGVARHRGAAMSISNKGYIGLGHFNGTGVNIVMKDWWQYDPATNSWAQKADFEGNAGNGNYAVVALGMESHGYIAGGNFAANETWKYTPLTNSWQQTQDVPENISDVVGFVIDEFGYCVFTSTLWALNGSTDLWEPRNGVSFTNSIWNSSFVIDGKGYLKNGYSLWEYKPSIDAWTSRASFPGLASGGSVGFSQLGKGYIVTGYQGGLSAVVKENWEFDPGTNTWTQFANFPGTSRRFATAFSIGDRSFLGTGTNGTNFKDFWEFSAILDVDEFDQKIQINVFPNPSSDQITVTWPNKSFDYKIYNLNGQMIANGKEFHQMTLFKNNIGRGVFMLHLNSGDKEVQQYKINFI